MIVMLLTCASVMKAEEITFTQVKSHGGGAIPPNGCYNSTNITLSATYDDSHLHVIIDDYTGNIELSIVDMDTNQIITIEEVSIVGSNVFDVDISSLPSHTYSVCIEFDDGSIYEGIMQK